MPAPAPAENPTETAENTPPPADQTDDTGAFDLATAFREAAEAKKVEQDARPAPDGGETTDEEEKTKPEAGKEPEKPKKGDPSLAKDDGGPPRFDFTDEQPWTTERLMQSVADFEKWHRKASNTYTEFRRKEHGFKSTKEKVLSEKQGVLAQQKLLQGFAETLRRGTGDERLSALSQLTGLQKTDIVEELNHAILGRERKKEPSQEVKELRAEMEELRQERARERQEQQMAQKQAEDAAFIQHRYSEIDAEARDPALYPRLSRLLKREGASVGPDVGKNMVEAMEAGETLDVSTALARIEAGLEAQYQDLGGPEAARQNGASHEANPAPPAELPGRSITGSVASRPAGMRPATNEEKEAAAMKAFPFKQLFGID